MGSVIVSTSPESHTVKDFNLSRPRQSTEAVHPYLMRLLGSLEASRMPDLDIFFSAGFEKARQPGKLVSRGSKPRLGVGLGHALLE
jgi:hypothetical protein